MSTKIESIEETEIGLEKKFTNDDWQERARKAAKQFDLPMPIEAPTMTEEALRQFEQAGGQ